MSVTTDARTAQHLDEILVFGLWQNYLKEQFAGRLVEYDDALLLDVCADFAFDS